MKKCSWCKLELPLTAFWNNSAGVLRSRCKQCDKKNERARRRAHPERYRAKKIRYYNAHRAEILEKCRQYYIANPERTQAGAQARNAIKKGTLRKEPCAACGKPNSEAHHDNYFKPLEVRWLCRSCHHLYHLEQRQLTAVG